MPKLILPGTAGREFSSIAELGANDLRIVSSPTDTRKHFLGQTNLLSPRGTAYH